MKAEYIAPICNLSTREAGPGGCLGLREQLGSARNHCLKKQSGEQLRITLSIFGFMCDTHRHIQTHTHTCLCTHIHTQKNKCEKILLGV